MLKIFLLLFLLLCGCHRAPFEEGEVLGADDFVMDSYALMEEDQPTPGKEHVMVAGAVKKEGIISVKQRYLPLRDVLVQAGGLAASGDRSKIYIFRGTQETPRIYAVRWEHLVRLPATSLLTLPGDIVFVSTKPIYQWGKRALDLFTKQDE